MRRKPFVVLLLGLASLPAFALPSRVFVKSSGVDMGSCPITAPCRSFAFAIGQVAASGEVIALDTAGYGPFTPTQSVSVFAAPGATAFIAVSSGTGIAIDSPVGPSDVIVLRGLALTGTGGMIGIDFRAGHSLAIENCIINGFPLYGVNMERTSDSTRPVLRMDHCTVRNSGGLFVQNFGPGLPAIGVTLSNSIFSTNSAGVAAAENTRVVITDSVFSGNVNGVFADTSPNGISEIDVERCSMTGNYRGILAGGGSLNIAVVRIAHNTITGNTTGVTETPGGGIIMTMTSGGTTTNTIAGNATDGTFSGTYTAK